MITKQVVREWRRPDLAETAELLVSELVTNAIRASCGLPEPAIRLWLASDRSNLVIRVWDGQRRAARLPGRRPGLRARPGPAAGPGPEQGLGVYRRGHGKVVWVLI